MKLLRSPAFYAILPALVGAIFGCVLVISSQLWLAILSGVFTVLLVIVGLIVQAYQQYMERNKNLFQTLARMRQHTPGLIDYCRDTIKLWRKRRHPTCQDCRKPTKHSQAMWIYAPIGQWNEALQHMECSHMWLCSICIERRLRDTADQTHLASESCLQWKTRAEQLRGQVVNLESEL